MGYGCGGGEEGGGDFLMNGMGRKGQAILAEDWRGSCWIE